MGVIVKSLCTYLASFGQTADHEVIFYFIDVLSSLDVYNLKVFVV